MGTNYYVAINYCDCCGRYDIGNIHIGKSSYGWCFCFRGYREKDLISWKSWKEYLKDKIITDEYGEKIDYDGFVQYIESEKSPSFVRHDGHKNLQHNEEGRNPRPNGYTWFNPEYDWDDEEGYPFCSREFS